MIGRWTEEEYRYLLAHAHEGAEAVAEHLGKSVASVEMFAHSNQIPVQKMHQCPSCCRFWSGAPSNPGTELCAECSTVACERPSTD